MSAALTVIVPLLLSPMVSVPAVIRSSSASVRPSTPPESAAPRLMAVPFVFGRNVTAFAPALIDDTVMSIAFAMIVLLLPVSVTVGVPEFMAKPNEVAPLAVPSSTNAPVPVVPTEFAVPWTFTPWLLPAVAVPVSVRAPFTVETAALEPMNPTP